MSAIANKIWRNLWQGRSRTALVVLSIAVGVFSLGLVFGSSDRMRVLLTESHRKSIPPHLIFYSESVFDQQLVEAIRRLPGIADAEGEAQADFRWRLEGEENWRKGLLIAQRDYSDQHMYVINRLAGDWPAKRTLAVERMSAQHFRIPIGTTIIVKVGQSERRVTVEGIVRHPYTDPPQLGLGSATFCVTQETMTWLTGRERGFDTLKVRLETVQDKAEASQRIRRHLERAGTPVMFCETVDDKIHWAQEQVDGVFLVLAVLGALALGLSGFLIANIMNATIVQQVWQIGVMKVIGATGGQLLRVYLVTVLVYGALALLLAVPLGVVSTHLLAGKLLDIFNIVLLRFEVSPKAVTIQTAVGLAVPVLAALVPVINGARITPREAISSHGMGGGFGRGWLDKLLGRVRRLPRPLALSLRNTFRRKARVVLTLLALTAGGVMFVMVMSVSASFDDTIDAALREFGHDVIAILERPRRVTYLEEVAKSIPDVTRAEVWWLYDAEMSLEPGAAKKKTHEKLDVTVWGIPLDSEMFKPRIIEGRSLQPGDEHAILLNQRIAMDKGFQVGDKIKLSFGERESTWEVVGLVLSIADDRTNYLPFDTLARKLGSVNRGPVLVVQSKEHDARAQEDLIDDLRATCAARHIKLFYVQSAHELREENKSEFRVILYLMLMMSILAAVVGGVGLMSTMSINVVERAREIGMMRAIGASSLAVVSIFVVEGVVIGLLSWLLAVPLSYPGAFAFSRAVGVEVINVQLDFRYSIAGALLWLLIVFSISVLASLLPALRATQVSVREALAYE